MSEKYACEEEMYRLNIKNMSLFMRQMILQGIGHREYWNGIGITDQIRIMIHEIKRLISPLKDLRVITPEPDRIDAVLPDVEKALDRADGLLRKLERL
tara:strand:+ start:2704 stop:2997 length:294 start_codon:yes stop_codon:yes gene_type:complete